MIVLQGVILGMTGFEVVLKTSKGVQGMTADGTLEVRAEAYARVYEGLSYRCLN